MKKYEILAVGGIYVDITAPHMPFDESGMAIEQELVGAGYEVVGGGSALNFSRLCTKLGLSIVIIGKTGDDETGKLVETLIHEAGVVPALVVDQQVSTNIGVNIINDAGQAMMVGLGTANQALTAEEVMLRAEPLLGDVQYLYLGSCLKLKRLLPAYETLAQHAQAADTKIIVDHGRLNTTTTNSDKEMVRKLVRLADFYFPSRDEFLELWNVESIESGLTSLNWGNTQVIVKDGSRGAVASMGGSVIRVPAYAVIPINPVGAGDSFNAGVIAAFRNGASLENAMRFGCATAALKISQPDLPNFGAIERLAAA